MCFVLLIVFERVLTYRENLEKKPTSAKHLRHTENLRVGSIATMSKDRDGSGYGQGGFHGVGFLAIDNCSVFGLGPVGENPGDSAKRTRTITRIVPDMGCEVQCQVIASHPVLIDETKLYTALMSDYNFRMVLGIRRNDRYFQKLCILDVKHSEEAIKFGCGSWEDVLLIQLGSVNIW